MIGKAQQVLRGLQAYAIAVLAVVATTAIFLPGRGYFAKSQWALLYLLMILCVASISGVRAALLAAALSFLCWNYFFLPPYHRFITDDPKDWLSLLVFLIVGIIMGLQTGKLRDKQAQALARERDTALLNRFSARLVSDLSLEDMADALISEITANTWASCAALFLPDACQELTEVSTAADGQTPSDSGILRLVEWSYREAKALGIPETEPLSAKPAGWPVSVSARAAGLDASPGDLVLPLQTAARQVGVLYVGGREELPFTFSQARLLVAIANQTAAFLERKQLQALAVQAGALQEADRLKSTFVSSVSHELKTPLASITATLTNILERDVACNEITVRNELQAISEDLERLNSSIGSLVDFSRLESAAWETRRDWYELGEIIGTTVSQMPTRDRPRIRFSLPDNLPGVYVDFAQVSRLLQNLLENALVYSRDTKSPVRVGASCTDADVRVWVEDEGPGIPPGERERIFEKFYRGPASDRAPSGTGLGLAIAAEIVRSHNGRMWVEDVAPHGTRMVVSLPRM